MKVVSVFRGGKVSGPTIVAAVTMAVLAPTAGFSEENADASVRKSLVNPILPGKASATNIPTTTSITTPTALTTSPAPTPDPCHPLVFAQRQYVVQTTESHIGVLMVLLPSPGAHVTGYNVRTPGYDGSLILNNSTGILQKAVRMNHQRVLLLVQAETPGGIRRNCTNNTDIVETDETLIIVDIMDENDSPPVLNCTGYGSSCSEMIVGFPSEHTALPTPLLRLTSTDDDVGLFGDDGLVYSVNSTAITVDNTGLFLLNQNLDEQHNVRIVAKDNLGEAPSMTAEAMVKVVPVANRQLFVVSTSHQLTSPAHVTSFLEDIRSAGGFRVVLCPEFQAVNYLTKELGGQDSTASKKGKLYVYAISQTDSGSLRAVEREEFQKALENLPDSDDVRFIETKEDQVNKGSSSQAAVTGLIIGLVVACCLLLIVIVAAMLRDRRGRRVNADTYVVSLEQNTS